MEILKIVSLIFAIFLAFFTLKNIKNGSVLNFPSGGKVPKVRLNKAENPFYFWMTIISYTLIIIFLILFGLGKI